MPATLADLVKIRSQPAEEALAFLERTAKAAAEVPPYYPEHLKALDPGSDKFDAIRQVVQAHDRKEYNEWLAKERERLRAAGLPDEGLAYREKRARIEGEDHGRETLGEKPKPRPIEWNTKTSQNYQRAVILGDPGFGKSWLLRFEARHLALSQFRSLAEQTITVDDVVLPLWARLSDLKDLTKITPDLRSALLLHFCRSKSPVFRRLLETQLAAKETRVVLLLDALDEVPEPERKTLRQRLSEFADAHPDVRILISSRLVGYGGLPLRDGNELELLPFNQNQIQHFLCVWFGESAKGRTTAQAFFDTLKTRPRLTALARIPLMLTLLCRTYESNSDNFPTRCVDLYEECFRALLRDWNAERFDLDDGYINAVLQFLTPVAYQLWQQEQEQFLATDLRDLFEDELLNLSKRQPTHEMVKRHDASSLIAELKATGIVITVGTEVNSPLLFLHRTFHQYLAACHLAGKYKLKHAPPQSWPKIAPIISRKAWLPEWQEVIVLLAGLQEHPAPLLEMLSDPNPTALNSFGDDVFRHRLALACLCLTEIRRETLDQHQMLLEWIATQAMDIWLENAQRQTEAVVQHLVPALPVLVHCKAHWRGQLLSTRIVEKLAVLDENVRRATAMTSGLIGQAAEMQDVVDALINRLEDRNVGVRWASAQALGRFGHQAATQQVIAALEAQLEDPETCVLFAGAKALVALKAEAAMPTVLTVLLNRFKSGNDHERILIATAFGRLGSIAAIDSVLLALEEGLADSNNAVCESCAEALDAIFYGDTPPGIPADIDDKLGDIAQFALQVLATAHRLDPFRLVQVTPEIVAKSNDWYRSDTEFSREWWAVYDSEEYTFNDMLAWLVDGLGNRDREVRKASANILFALGPSAVTSPVTEALIKGVEDGNPDVQIASINALGRFGSAAAKPDVVAVLINRLKDRNEDEEVRQASAYSLGQFGCVAATSEVLTVLAKGIKERGIAETSIQSLASIGIPAATPTVITAL
ncbi:MAG: HEAT repeat domain-containing protein [Methylococcales bacterium]